MTAAVLLVDDERFARTVYSDYLRQAGYEVVYTPYAELSHYESASRGTLHPPADEAFFCSRWGHPGELVDPYYNPNLDLTRPYRIKIDDRG